ncbi:hypothetical protein ANRL3_02490 [Anaerolineae bacterium]|nr:hypothetical protein ANRL3_02490 [Anaerolineae bacterium]
MSNPSDVARLAHRFLPYVANTVTSEEIVASRVQRYEPAINPNLEVYDELGSVDPTGYASDAPEFRITLEENVHDCDLDMVLAGLDPAGLITTWQLADYINDGNIKLNLLERNNAGTIIGESEFGSGVLTEIAWSWRMGQAITAQYAFIARYGKRYKAANVVHATWGATSATAPGGIKIKDARLFLGGTAAGNRVYRLQSFSLRHTFRAEVHREAGNRALVGATVHVPTTRLDIELLAADGQPDDILFHDATTYYDYASTNLLAANAIRIYDPSAAEGTTVLRAWSIENLVPGDASPVQAQVRSSATKRYSLSLPKATTAGSSGVILYSGDIV